MVANVDYLDDLAHEILATAIDALEDNAITPPVRQFVSPGAIADDCDQIAVELARIFTGRPGAEVAEPEQCGYARTAEFFIRIVRCLASASDDDDIIPTPDELNGDAKIVMRDIWVIHQELITRRAAGTFLDRCQNLLVGNALPAGPEGGLGGWQLLIQVQIHGI